jgi:DNA-binding NtrC family response regulator
MMPQVAIVAAGPLSLDSAVLRSLDGAGWTYELKTWNSFPSDQFRNTSTGAILVVADPFTDQAFAFFRNLPSWQALVPVLAVLPANLEPAALHEASCVVDDFVLAPFREQEFRQRLARIQGPQCDATVTAIEPQSWKSGLTQMLGTGPNHARTIQQLRVAGASDAPVLLTGETGTGKELCARAIHALGRRRDGPFVPIECGALPEHLAENELFGHARGAFTDAHAEQKGLAALAEGGTLFLDEVDSLSLGTQAKLLRFLQENTYRALGADHFKRADVRVIAATNREMTECVRAKEFRQDLYFRLDVLRIHLPPLRERRADVEVLARHFTAALCHASGIEHKILSPAAIRKLESYDWPGNIRELHNLVHRAILYSQGPVIQASHMYLPSRIEGHEAEIEGFRSARMRAIESFESGYVQEMLRKHQGNITHAAMEAGKDRRAFGRLVKKYKLAS